MKNVALAACLLPIWSAWAETAYFLVGEPEGREVYNDSFVLPLTDPQLIDYARQLIDQGPSAGGTIVFASVRAGADGINRDYGNPVHGTPNPNRPAWSWHIDPTLPISFGDWGAELLDGWPSYVESDVPGWIDNTSDESDPPGVGRIGFWNYTVLAELSLLSGDTDGDGDIDDFDLIAAITNYTGSLPAGSGSAAWGDGDTDSHGDVDDFDLITMITGYTGSLSTPSVPEPAGLSLLAAGLPVLTRRRR